MDNALPSEFDLVIVGTGLIESVIAAAASRIGKTVLHIDSNDFYGGLWASFNLDALIGLAGRVNKDVSLLDDANRRELCGDGETLVTFADDLKQLQHLKCTWHIPKSVEGEGSWSQDSVLKESRKFNLDLMPKLQFARGHFVELLISSNIARYSEFRCVSRILTWAHGKLELVPCSSADVFNNENVSVVEKRILMKLFETLGKESAAEFENHTGTMVDFLKEMNFTPNLIHYVLYSIAMASNEKMPCKQGIENVKRFLKSLCRFGKTPFLYSSYGSGELPQAFCRLCAVFGGIYALNQPLNGIVISNDGNHSLLAGEQRIKANTGVITSLAKVDVKIGTEESCKRIARAIFITDKSIMVDDKEHLSLAFYPPVTSDGHTVTIIEAGHMTGTCPKDLYIVHLISMQCSTPEDDFAKCKEDLFGTDKPTILWSCYFSLPFNDMSSFEYCSIGDKTYKGLYVCPGPDIDLDYDAAIAVAEQMFNSVYPGEEFLPRAPDPEEIVLEGDDDVAGTEGEATAASD